jgi:hypothetical protein
VQALCVNSWDSARSREMETADKQPEKSSVVRLPMPVAVIVRGGVWLRQLGDRHWQSSAFSFQASDLSLSRKASGSDENHASSFSAGPRTRPYSAVFSAGISHRTYVTASSAAPLALATS